MTPATNNGAARAFVIAIFILALLVGLIILALPE
jgi:hypothetical protein